VVIEIRQCLLPFIPETSVVSFAFKKLKIRIYKNIILHVVLYGYGIKVGT
jgi:hypothetical protein